jgi:hypothetical protein
MKSDRFKEALQLPMSKGKKENRGKRLAVFLETYGKSFAEDST